MISIKTSSEIQKMKESNRIVAEFLSAIEEKIKPGVSTFELNIFAEKFIKKQKAVPAFKGYKQEGLLPFPAAICASVNNVIVHGIPDIRTILQEGDIIGVDVGVLKNGYYGDAAKTFAVGQISPKVQELLNVTKEALDKGIAVARHGARVGDISATIGDFVLENGYYIADNLTGHGIGRNLHEEPVIPNIGVSGRGPRLKKGMTIAIEPMVNVGTNKTKRTGWIEKVQDDSLSAHFEHTILITENEPVILTLN